MALKETSVKENIFVSNKATKGQLKNKVSIIIETFESNYCCIAKRAL